MGKKATWPGTVRLGVVEIVAEVGHTSFTFVLFRGDVHVWSRHKLDEVYQCT